MYVSMFDKWYMKKKNVTQRWRRRKIEQKCQQIL